MCATQKSAARSSRRCRGRALDYVEATTFVYRGNGHTRGQRWDWAVRNALPMRQEESRKRARYTTYEILCIIGGAILSFVISPRLRRSKSGITEYGPPSISSQYTVGHARDCTPPLALSIVPASSPLVAPPGLVIFIRLSRALRNSALDPGSL